MRRRRKRPWTKQKKTEKVLMMKKEIEKKGSVTESGLYLMGIFQPENAAYIQSHLGFSVDGFTKAVKEFNRFAGDTELFVEGEPLVLRQSNAELIVNKIVLHAYYKLNKDCGFNPEVLKKCEKVSEKDAKLLVDFGEKLFSSFDEKGNAEKG
jgi:hypothetical protein